MLYFCTMFATFVPSHVSSPAVSSWWPVGSVVIPSRRCTSLCDLLQFSLQFVDRSKLLLTSWSLLRSTTTELGQTDHHHLYQLQGNLVVNLSSSSPSVDFYFLWSFIFRIILLCFHTSQCGTVQCVHVCNSTLLSFKAEANAHWMNVPLLTCLNRVYNCWLFLVHASLVLVTAI